MDLEDNLEMESRGKLEGIFVLGIFASVATGVVYSLGCAYTTYIGEIVENFYSYFLH